MLRSLNQFPFTPSTGAIRAAVIGVCSALLAIAGCSSDGGGGGGGGGQVGLRPDDSMLSSESHAALNQLVSQNPAAAALAANASGVLVFPNMIKGGFIIGGFYGDGVMIQNGFTTGYYDSTGASYGLQAGLQRYAYALFFMSDEDLAYLINSGGWEIGVGPSVTIVDQGLAGSLTSTTVQKGIYCFFFDQSGLMAGLGLQGSKITRIDD